MAKGIFCDWCGKAVHPNEYAGIALDDEPESNKHEIVYEDLCLNCYNAVKQIRKQRKELHEISEYEEG